MSHNELACDTALLTFLHLTYNLQGGKFTQYQARFQSIADNAGANSGTRSSMYYSIDIVSLTSTSMWHGK